ncbi:hypothetical protein ACIBL5_36460 [Streptomyces sp. NPDC050516]|uniref:hypothetical protein n=1 Tax=Streptomyces sp. NPDC050516 TaxID=3365621 RepID=UPI00379117CF
MARGSVGGADRELIARLAERNLVVSATQLERWRREGLLPAHQRRGLGRGRGSAAVLEDRVVEAAAALARHTRQGCDLRWTVLTWYIEAALPSVPEPPWDCVRAALLWAMERSPVQRLLVQARMARTEPAQDAFYAAANRALPHKDVARPHPDVVRRAMLDGVVDELAPQPQEAVRERWLVTLVAAAGMGAEELDGQAVAEAFAAWGLLPSQVDRHMMAKALEQAELKGLLADLLAPLETYDPLRRLAEATEHEIARARDVATMLAGVGAVYLMHGLLMPDTPSLAALRRQVDEMGVGQELQEMVLALTRPRDIPQVLSMCLDPEVAALNEHLQALLADELEGLLHRPGQAHDPRQYKRDWIAALEALAEKYPDQNNAEGEPV